MKAHGRRQRVPGTVPGTPAPERSRVGAPAAARYVLEWREARSDGDQVTYGHCMERPRTDAEVANIAKALGDIAWNQEFRVARGRDEVYTNLRRINDWVGSGVDLPDPEPRALWRRDLERIRAADAFVLSVRAAVGPALSAGVLLRRDGDRLLRAVAAMPLRPRI